MSTTRDLVKFGNKMLGFYQSKNDAGQFLKSSTINSIVWAPHSVPTKSGEKNYFASDIHANVSYGMGWFVSRDITNNKEEDNLKYVFHTGGACGATSCLFIKPEEKHDEMSHNAATSGVVVAVLCNSQDVSDISKFTIQLANVYAE